MRAGLVAACLVLPTVAFGQDDSIGPKFIEPGERTDRFEEAFQSRRACPLISHNVSFCPDQNDWATERPIEFDQPAFFRLDEATVATVTVIWMEEDQSFDLTPDQLEAIVDQHVYEEAARGGRAVEHPLYRKETQAGRLFREAVLVTQDNNDRRLRQLTVFLLDYGVGLLETTIRLRDDEKVQAIEDWSGWDVHNGFLDAIRISHSIYP